MNILTLSLKSLHLNKVYIAVQRSVVKDFLQHRQ